jgi:tyrosyl-tRNA synthetase
MHTLKNKEKFVLTMKLLADDEGKKMGKSEGNAVFLNSAPNDMYGIVMSWPDGTIATAFELCTNVPYEEVKQIAADLKKPNANPRDLKMQLALEITKINHGEKLAQEAQENFVKTIQNKEMPDDIPSYKTKSASINIVELLVASQIASSKNEARRLIEQGGIKIKEDGDFVTVKDINLVVKIKKEIIIQRGKRQYLRITK